MRQHKPLIYQRIHLLNDFMLFERLQMLKEWKNTVIDTQTVRPYMSSRRR